MLSWYAVRLALVVAADDDDGVVGECNDWEQLSVRQPPFDAESTCSGLGSKFILWGQGDVPMFWLLGCINQSSTLPLGDAIFDVCIAHLASSAAQHHWFWTFPFTFLRWLRFLLEWVVYLNNTFGFRINVCFLRRSEELLSLIYMTPQSSPLCLFDSLLCAWSKNNTGMLQIIGKRPVSQLRKKLMEWS